MCGCVGGNRVQKILSVVVSLMAVVFLAAGLLWLIAPSSASALLGMPLLTGVALSTQIGDLSSFFLSSGLFIMMGLMTKKSTWFYLPVTLLSVAAFGRIMSTLVHGAPLALDLIIPEIVSAVILFLAAKRLCWPDSV